MSLMKQSVSPSIPFLSRGFRPFFLGASIFSIISIFFWVNNFYTHMSWHAHEMIYGYVMAVVAGFLLTAVKNWTGVETVKGMPLLALFSVWAVARISFLFSSSGAFVLGAIADCLFNLFFIIAISIPIIKVKQWRNMSIILKIALLFFSNLIFYFGITGIIPDGVRIGLYSGLYLLIALIVTISRRVYPFFIKKAQGVDVKNYPIINKANLIVFLLFWLSAVIYPTAKVTGVIAGILFFLNLCQLIGWYHSKIWTQSLLWSIYLSYAAITLGFAFVWASVFFNLSSLLSVHIFTIGGIALMTTSLMCRVSLGHTGRNVYSPPKMVKYILLLIITSALFRVVFPFYDVLHYGLWINLAATFWIMSFSLFVISYAPMLLTSRVDHSTP